ncbi:hypothetical protein AOLI_G00309890 [Acnodon oligacanthus]
MSPGRTATVRENKTKNTFTLTTGPSQSSMCICLPSSPTCACIYFPVLPPCFQTLPLICFTCYPPVSCDPLYPLCYLNPVFAPCFGWSLLLLLFFVCHCLLVVDVGYLMSVYPVFLFLIMSVPPYIRVGSLDLDCFDHDPGFAPNKSCFSLHMCPPSHRSSFRDIFLQNLRLRKRKNEEQRTKEEAMEET